MSAIPSPIADIALAPGQSTASARGLSLGILLADGAVGWGDLVLPPGFAPPAAWQAVAELLDHITPRLRSQQHPSLAAFGARLGTVFEDSDSPIVAPLRLALQQAWLEVAAAGSDQTAARRLAAEYGLAPVEPATPALFLEISDHAATAERIDRMLALRPAGIGYRLTGVRVVEAIGQNAELLQRFVRQLGDRADMLAPGESYRPAMYLSLNGALGNLAEDPVRHIGKVLGHVVGLQSATGERRLILEEPFLLPDQVDQVSNLHRLKDFIRRTPDSLRRAEPTLLVAPSTGVSEDERRFYADTAAVHALSFDPLAEGDLLATLDTVVRTRASGLEVVLRLPSTATPRWIATLTALSDVLRPLALLISCDESLELATFAARMAGEAAVMAARRQIPR